jgi:hypothetical protein
MLSTAVNSAMLRIASVLQQLGKSLEDEGMTNRIYNEVDTGDWMWEMQVRTRVLLVLTRVHDTITRVSSLLVRP